MGRTEGDQSSPRGCKGGGTRELKISANRLKQELSTVTSLDYFDEMRI